MMTPAEPDPKIDHRPRADHSTLASSALNEEAYGYYTPKRELYRSIINKPMARALQQRKRDRDIRVCTAFFGGNMVCLRRCIDEFGWKEEREVSCMDDCAVVWFGNHVNHLSAAGDLQLLTSHRQRAPRFEGLRILCWKDNTAVCIEALRELFPEEFQFWPRGYRLPEERPAFMKALRMSGKAASPDERKTYILKPSETSQGTGIFLAQGPSDLPQWFVNPPTARAERRRWVVQEYVDPCMLLDGYKFDLRMCKAEPPNCLHFAQQPAFSDEIFFRLLAQTS